MAIAKKLCCKVQRINEARHLRQWYFVIDEPFTSTFYLSGPPEMIKTLSNDLNDRAVGLDAIRVDGWE